jgi:hypothetical protein
MECEKRAVRDFHSAVNPKANAEKFLTAPTNGPALDMVEGGREALESTQHRKIEIQESNRKDTTDTIPIKLTPWIIPPPKSGVPNKGLFSINGQSIEIPIPLRSLGLDEGPSHLAGPSIEIPLPHRSLGLDEGPYHLAGPTIQDLQNIKNIILTLQLDLQDERTKRECLEEKVRRIEGNLTRQSQEMSERKWRLSDMRIPNQEIPQDQSFLPAQNTINDVDENIAELRSDFDLRLSSLDQSLLEIRSILENNPVGNLKRDGRMSLGPSPSEEKDYNRFLYKKLERGVFPPQISLKNAITKSVDELLHKPWAKKTEIEAMMDQYYLDNLPPAFLRPDDIENINHTPMTKAPICHSTNQVSLSKIL